jgi:integrase
VTTRNARLAAIHSLFRYAALRTPEHAALIARVLGVPSKRQHRPLVCFLDREEIEALLAAPDQTHWTGRRDHAVLLVLTQTGLRVSELTGLAVQDVHLDTGAHVFCHGKGRKDRCTPLTSQTVMVLRSWLTERRGHDQDPLFPTRRGGPLSSDAVERLVAKHAITATNHCPSLQAKTVTPHVLRHSAAMALLVRRRHHRHRALARTRVAHNDPCLPSRRPGHEGTSPGPDHTTRHASRALPRPRRPARLPQRSLSLAPSAPNRPRYAAPPRRHRLATQDAHACAA